MIISLIGVLLAYVKFILTGLHESCKRMEDNHEILAIFGWNIRK
jgi:hypothetical protein